ncbi:hypothetical protein E3T39_03890 [Cryobacterium suzukii]|uniref:Uncharacterized protein n=1 Tax=Cryobacterium suzukii TaxID=1259198 RepID=A0A4R9AHI1_9MICO|nr:hypothetical protein E3T39_03890 [Cryobacterium suzukii]
MHDRVLDAVDDVDRFALLVGALGVTGPARHDLVVLERQGGIRRQHGGGRLVQSTPFEIALAQRRLEDAPQKHRIAQRVLQELPDDDVVLLPSPSREFQSPSRESQGVGTFKSP